MLDHRIPSTVKETSQRTQTTRHSLAGANAGHIPNALNIPYTDVLDQSDPGLKSNEELKQGTSRMAAIAIVLRFLSSFH